MKLFQHSFLEYAIKINNEIVADKNDWFRPKGKVGGGQGPGDFDYGQMKFLNRNLNYFYYENMISHAIKNNYDYNKNFPTILEFTEYLRIVLNENGPYGRMCIWKLEPTCYLLPHVDNWPYHRNIRRYIFIVSDHGIDDALVKISGVNIPISQGTLFQFHPHNEMHEFVNNSSKNFYFLGFDYWDVDILKHVAKFKKISIDSNIEYHSGFGAYNTKCKYMSKE